MGLNKVLSWCLWRRVYSCRRLDTGGEGGISVGPRKRV